MSRDPSDRSALSERVAAGVAEADRTTGRDALVAKAKEEWAASNSDEQLGGLCKGILAAPSASGTVTEVGPDTWQIRYALAAGEVIRFQH